MAVSVSPFLLQLIILLDRVCRAGFCGGRERRAHHSVVTTPSA
ncbi:MAG: hypothetical protein Q9O62_12535 [Ardenticatenia bacterium]|nr:hypothetical protein [Ardenticatenia bacterium]